MSFNQPLEDHGCGRRFRANKIVEELFSLYLRTTGGPNPIHSAEYSKEDKLQFAQLLGYSESSYRALPFITDEDLRRAGLEKPDV